MSVWLELFYDLVFVAAILVLSDAASHHADGTRVLRVVAIFVGLWTVWLATTLYTNRFRVHDVKHRLLVLAQMFVVVLVAMEAHAGVRPTRPICRSPMPGSSRPSRSCTHASPDRAWSG